MFEIDALLAVVFLLVIGVVVVATVQRGALRAKQLQSQPNTELARAVRLLDRILAVDDAFPQLPTELRDEAKRITATYYRELEE